MSGERKRIKIVIDVFTGGSFRYEGGEIEGIRIFPACKYAFCGSRRLSPVELNEAVQMWMNRAPTNGPVWDNLNAALVEKGAKITRLKDYQDVHMTRIIELEDRIAELEKLSTMQKATIDAQGKELHQKQIALANLQDLVNPKRRPCLTCENTECDILIGADQTCWTQAQKKEPSQTPAPEEGRTPLQHLQDRVLEMEQHQGRDRADLMEKIRELETEISEVKRYVQYGIDELEFI